VTAAAATRTQQPAGGREHRATELTTETWQALGTTALIRYAGPRDPRVRAAVESELEAIDAAASRFSPTSELSRLNAADGARRAISPLLLEALTLAVRAAEISDGAVDPTLGASLVNAGYDRDFSQLQPPVPDAPGRHGHRLVVHRRRRRLWREIGLREDPPSAVVPPGVSLDLGATAKALASDRAARAASANAGVGVLVSLGGDIATAGPAPAGGWMVHVTDDHRDGAGAPGQTIAIQSGGLATSSVLARRWMHDGEAMHHILDPADGHPVRPFWRTVSVAAASCADANIASTAAIVLGPGAADWLVGQGLPARLVAPGGELLTLCGWPE
jgi:FAD:protein FMN transferase